MEPVIKQSILPRYVKNIWTLENHDFENTDHSLKFFADGCPGLMFSQAQSGIFIGDQELSTFFLYGQTVKPIEIVTKGSYKIVVFILHPHVVNTLFGINANDLTDTCMDMNQFSAFAKETGSQLMAAGNMEEQIRIMEAFIGSLANSGAQDPLMERATRFIMDSKGEAPLREVQRVFKISERTFERRFSQHVGITPKLFSKICRFDSSIKQLEKGNYEKLSDIAYENGYADQSHFVRTFKEFTNTTPREHQSKKIK
jgi:AraC-like DNA-binding protein